MLSLIAAAYDDGYAFVKDESRIYSIRPPYKGKILSTTENVERAVSAYGFSIEQIQFNDWASLIDYLKAKFIEKRKQIGENAPDVVKIRRLVQRAPQDKVESFIDRIQNGLIPNHEWKAAISVLTHLLKNRIVRDDISLWERCTDLLERCQTSKNKEEEEALELFNRDESDESIAEEFPLAFEYYGDEIQDLARRVRTEGQLLIVGAV
jgi:hypothetical protein